MRFMTVDQAQLEARGRVPRSVYRFLEGGTDAEVTVAENRSAFRDVTFLPRAGVVHTAPDLATELLGVQLAMPVVLAPAGYIRLAHRDAEVGSARAVADAGLAIGVSTLSSHDVFDVAATGAATWYQLYFAGGRPGAEVAIERATEAGCRALIVTLDLAASSGRERTLRGGGAIPTRVTVRSALTYLPELLPRPRWLFDFARDGLRLDVPNVRLTKDGEPLSAAAASKSMREAAPSWQDFAWIREQWSGPIVVKGLLTADDARRAVDVGADAVVVSNHGGNALDGTPATIRMLPEVVAAVGDRMPVLMDGGVRRGSDIVKALALGARAVLIGRAYIWGLAAGGTEGVARVLQLLRDDVSRTLTLLGCASVHELDRTFVEAPWAPRQPRRQEGA